MKVELLDATENPEQLICQAARNDYMADFIGDTDYADAMSGVDGDSLADKTGTLIEHLLDRGHFGPFEHPHATFAVEGISRSCMAQLTRHRHASFDVQSMRYVSFDDVTPTPGEAFVEIPGLDDTELHGRRASFAAEKESVPDATIEFERRHEYEQALQTAHTAYENLLDLGIPPQDARMVLPIGTKVNLVFSLNARMLMHVADMRAEADAQWEIRELTESVLELAEDWCPNTFEYYNTELKGRKNRLAP